MVKPLKKEVDKGGRPTKYQEAYKEQARKLCLMGYIDRELADFFNISEATLNNWKKSKKGFLESLKAGREVADMEVTASLYQRATGYSHKETKVFNNQGEIVTHDVQRIYPPDPLSIKYWLNNRQPQKWREKVDDSSLEQEAPIQKITVEVVGANGSD